MTDDEASPNENFMNTLNVIYEFKQRCDLPYLLKRLGLQNYNTKFRPSPLPGSEGHKWSVY